jgi:hypothetical protein
MNYDIYLRKISDCGQSNNTIVLFRSMPNDTVLWIDGQTLLNNKAVQAFRGY